MKKRKHSLSAWFLWFLYSTLTVGVAWLLWGHIWQDLAANTVWFLIAMSVAWLVWLLSRRSLIIDAKSFFGMGTDARIFAYISAHVDPTTTTQQVITAAEFDAAATFNKTILSQFEKKTRLSEFLQFVARLSELDFQSPTLLIQASPLVPSILPNDEKSVLLMGGPVRNKLAEVFLSQGSPWLNFDLAKEKFVISRGSRAGEELEPSGQMAIVNRMRVDDKIAFIAFGFGESYTKIAVDYLAHNWRTLYHEFKDKEFGICLVIGNDNQAQVKMKLADD